MAKRSKIPKRSKRVVIISDLHCGHAVGLTPVSWQHSCSKSAPQALKNLEAMRQKLWNFYHDTIKKLQPIDILIVNGDAIDGSGTKSGGVELITSDRNIQADMAAENIKLAKADKIIMTFGTGYHTGDQEDFERGIATEVGAEKIGGHEWVDVNGTIFDVKHHIGSSGIPHGRHTHISKERLWNILWSDYGEDPRANVIIRSHVHYHNFCGGADWLGMTTPALQGLGSRYGVRRCSGIVDFGLIHFDVDKDGDYQWSSHILKLQKSNESIKV